jgi:hypothetical protein
MLNIEAAAGLLRPSRSGTGFVPPSFHRHMGEAGGQEASPAKWACKPKPDWATPSPAARSAKAGIAIEVKREPYPDGFRSFRRVCDQSIIQKIVLGMSPASIQKS